MKTDGNVVDEEIVFVNTVQSNQEDQESIWHWQDRIDKDSQFGKGTYFEKVPSELLKLHKRRPTVTSAKGLTL